MFETSTRLQPLRICRALVGHRILSNYIYRVPVRT